MDQFLGNPCLELVVAPTITTIITITSTIGCLVQGTITTGGHDPSRVIVCWWNIVVVFCVVVV